MVRGNEMKQLTVRKTNVKVIRRWS